MRARLGGWSVRGLGAMDNYTHLCIEDLRPIAEKLAVDAIKRIRETSTFSTQTPGVEKHSQGK
jgi:hypothetical protein